MKKFAFVFAFSLMLTIILFNLIQIDNTFKLIFLPFYNSQFYFLFFIIILVNYFFFQLMDNKIIALLILLNFLFILSLHFNFFSTSDFKKRSYKFLIIIIAAIAFNLLHKLNSLKVRFFNLFNSLPKNKFYLFLIPYLFYLFFSIETLFPQIGFVGDEPHYLLITHSIVNDKDLNVRNNYFNKDYLHYVNGKLRIQAVIGKKGPSEFYSIHMPMISFFLAPFYWMGAHFSRNILIFIIKAGMSLIAALLSFSIYHLLKKIFSQGVSSATWAIYTFLPPIFFYSRQVYPETSAASLSLISYYYFLKGYKILPAIFSGILPLFGSKYLAISIGFLVVYILDIIRNKNWKSIWRYSFWFLSIALYFLFLRTLYSYNIPFAQYHGETGKSKMLSLINFFLFQLDWKERIGSFFSYFLDQRDGLLPYTPIYFFSFLGIIWAYKRCKKFLFDLLIISLPYIGVYAFLTHRGGFCPPARPLVAISWIFPIFLAFFFEYNKNTVFKYFAYLALIYSIATLAILIKYPIFSYQATTHNITDRASDYFKFLSNFYVYLPDYFPSFLKIEGSYWIPNYIWVALIFLLIPAYWYCTKIPQNFAFNNKFIFSLFILLPTALYFSAVPQFSLKSLPFSEQNNVKLYFFSNQIKINNMNFNITGCRPIEFIFESKKPLQSLKISFNLKENHHAELKYFDKPIGIFSNNEHTNIFLNKKYKAKLYNYYLFSLENSPEIKNCPLSFHIDII